MVALTSTLVTPFSARADVCDALETVRMAKLKIQNDAVLESVIVKQIAGRLAELKASTGDVQLTRWIEIAGGVIALSITWGTSWSKAKEANRYYENGYRLIGDLIKKSPTFGFFALAGTFAVVDGGAHLIIHATNIASLEKELDAQKVVLLNKYNILEEKIGSLDSALRKAGCKVPEEELMNALDTDELIIQMVNPAKWSKKRAQIEALHEAAKTQVEKAKDAELRAARMRCEFIEGDYLMFNKDIADGVKAGTLDAKEHYVRYGKKEGRIFNIMCIKSPTDNSCPWVEADYLELNPDVAKGIADKTIGSAAYHFGEVGHKEKRRWNKLCN